MMKGSYSSVQLFLPEEIYVALVTIELYNNQIFSWNKDRGL